MNTYPIDPQYYQRQLDEKILRLQHQLCTQLATVNITTTLPAMAVYPSAPLHYRMRAEFRIWHKDDRAYYAMHSPGADKRPSIIDNFVIAAKSIHRLMPKVLAAVNSRPVLRTRLFQVEFLSTLKGDTLVSFIYHKPLDEHWIDNIQSLKTALGIQIIGRSRRQKITLDKDYVTEHFNIADAGYYEYQQVEGAFTQPNAGINIKMIEWVLKHSRYQQGDLLELYCGNGNFTLPLAGHFNRVLATEISKSAVKSANHNIQRNKITNITVVRMSSEEFSLAMDKVRPFRRLRHIDLNDYSFSTVLVDPPRAGLDGHTLAIVKRLNTIIYISCNPTTLIKNLQSLCASHRITAIAAFDQFPYTDHLEVGVILNRSAEPDQ